jgi:hypothetical protein
MNLIIRKLTNVKWFSERLLDLLAKGRRSSVALRRVEFTLLRDPRGASGSRVGEDGG